MSCDDAPGWKRYLPWMVIGLYAALVAVGVAHHEPWVDEAQAWQIARSLSLREMFVHVLRYEGSPGLWHTFLHLLIRVGVGYTAMRWITAAFAVAGIALLVLRSPFPAWVRFLLPFTFWLSFQYAVVARSYVFAPLLLFALAIVWRRQSALPAAVLLALLANLSLHFTAVSFAFALVYAVEMNRGQRHPRHIALAAVLLVLAWCAAALTVLPQPPDLISPIEQQHAALSTIVTLRILRAGVYLARAASAQFSTGVVVALALLVALWGNRRLLYSLPVFLLALFSSAYFNFWHTGLAIPTAIAVCWMAWPLEVRPRWRALLARGVFVFWLAIQLAGTVHSFAYDFRHDYAPEPATAQFLRPLVARGERIAVTEVKDSRIHGFHAVGLLPYFSGPLYVNEPRTFWLWSEREHTDADFQKALATHPDVVMAIYFDQQFGRYDPVRDLARPNMRALTEKGYVLTHTFCGAKPEVLSEREQICDLIFEASPLQNSTK